MEIEARIKAEKEQLKLEQEKAEAKKQAQKTLDAEVAAKKENEAKLAKEA